MGPRTFATPALLLATCLAGCGVEVQSLSGVTYSVGGTDRTCLEGAQRCVESSLQACVGDAWRRLEDCSDTAQSCLDDGTGTASCGVATSTGFLPRIISGNARGTMLTPVLTVTGTDFNPSVMLDGVYSLWWQARLPESVILYAEASQLDGPWHDQGTTSVSGTQVFAPTGNANTFDANSVGNPKVLAVSGGFYMYYNGSNSKQTAIGVARSTDRLTWTRLNNGLPIVRSALAAGSVTRPRVVRQNNKFYMLYADTAGGGNVGGVGSYMLRADDPLFTQNVMELQASGFAPFNQATHSTYALQHEANHELVYVDALGVWLVVSGNPNQITASFYDPNFKRLGGTMSLPGGTARGLGMVTRTDGHALPGLDCNSIPVDMLQTVGAGSKYNIVHNGVDFFVNLPCSAIPVAQVYETTRLTTITVTTPVVVASGQGVSIQNPSTAQVFSKTAFTVSDAIMARIPSVATIANKATAYTTSGASVGMYDPKSGLLLPVGCETAVQVNGSALTSLAAGNYNALKRGPTLPCIP